MSESDTSTETPPTTSKPAQASDVKVVTEPASSRRAPWRALGAVTVVAVLGFLVFSQFQLIAAVEDAEASLAETRAQIVSLDSRVAGVSVSVDELADEVTGLATAQSSGGSTPANVISDGSLPQFVQGVADTAIGLTLGPISGVDGYTSDQVTIDPADGNKRVWMVWAHWCPYCQEELPILKAMHPTFATEYPGVELATISTSIDPARGNPLDDYLAAEQFTFPVVVDTDMTAAAQVGANAFPFWIVTDTDGTVLLRVAGYMDADRLDALLTSVAEFEA